MLGGSRRGVLHFDWWWNCQTWAVSPAEPEGFPIWLRVDSIPEPEIGPQDVLIRVRATSLNGFDPQYSPTFGEAPTIEDSPDPAVTCC